MVVTPAIANLIRENKTYRIDSAIQTGKKYGMQLLDDHLWQFYQKGMITAEEGLDKARHPAELQDKIDKLRREGTETEDDEASGASGSKLKV
jgi:twitching motility protein PilT